MMRWVGLLYKQHNHHTSIKGIENEMEEQLNNLFSILVAVKK